MDEINGENGLEQITALVHFHFNEDPDTIDRLAMLWGRLQFALEFKGELQTTEINFG